MQSVNPKIKTLLKNRANLRKQGHFDKSDKIRKEIELLGYTIVDQGNETIIEKVVSSDNKRTFPFLTIFGGGEISSQGRQIHEYIFKKIGKADISVKLITTPAGFQPNVKIVYEEIADFFGKHLTNFHPKIELIEANTLSETDDPEIARKLDGAEYIFIGPGSPTYAVKHLKDSLLYKEIINKVKQGASIAISSAAAIAFSKYALPVYEIYKVGEPLHWIEGLDLYSQIYKSITIIPHFNNNEGGKKNDTSHCWMGKKRFDKLRKMIANESVFGIDEHTGLIINLETQKTTVLGKGKVYKT